MSSSPTAPTINQSLRELLRKESWKIPIRSNFFVPTYLFRSTPQSSEGDLHARDEFQGLPTCCAAPLSSLPVDELLPWNWNLREISAAVARRSPITALAKCLCFLSPFLTRFRNGATRYSPRKLPTTAGPRAAGAYAAIKDPVEAEASGQVMFSIGDFARSPKAPSPLTAGDTDAQGPPSPFAAQRLFDRWLLGYVDTVATLAAAAP